VEIDIQEQYTSNYGTLQSLLARFMTVFELEIVTLYFTLATVIKASSMSLFYTKEEVAVASH
jgi:hypothetical protein